MNDTALQLAYLVDSIMAFAHHIENLLLIKITEIVWYFNFVAFNRFSEFTTQNKQTL